MRARLAVSLVAFFSTVGAANAWHTGERVAAKHCEHGRVLSCLHRASLHNRISYGWLRGVAACESHLNPWAVNRSSGAAGLMQFLPSTWARTPYARHSVFSAKWSSLAAARMFAQGQSGQWSCA